MKRNLSLGGAAALFVGTFLPLVHAPFIGSLSMISRPDGVLLASVVAVGALFALCNKVGVTSSAGWLSLAILITDYVDMTSRINNPGTTSQFANSLIKATVSPGEAWPVLFLGALAMIAAAFLKEPKAVPQVNLANANRAR